MLRWSRSFASALFLASACTTASTPGGRSHTAAPDPAESAEGGAASATAPTTTAAPAMSTPPAMTAAPATTTAPAESPPLGPPSSYPGHGFIVHEWGTDTILVGSDGSLQRGLHHEQEDLPPFVYDRVKAGQELSVRVKMETPVTYFYSDHSLAVTANVAFPHGIFSQWYPEVTRFAPGIAFAGDVAIGPPAVPAQAGDPFLDERFPFVQSRCASYYPAALQNGDPGSGWSAPVGLIDWGVINVLPRGTSASLPDAPLDLYTWGYARQVDSNPVQNAGGQSEKFLFYRGLGDFGLPVRVTAARGGAVSMTNTYGDPVGTVFVLNVGDRGGAFVRHTEGIAAGATLFETALPIDTAPSLETFVQSLGTAVTDALAGTGLYDDEAAAMVSTWARQWFRTPGLRLLYLAPQSWTDASIPLGIAPAPDTTKRVMMIRVEVLTPEIESADAAQAGLLASADTAPAAQAYFTALGRFAEPRLRRALALLSNPSYGDATLSQVAATPTTVASGE